MSAVGTARTCALTLFLIQITFAKYRIPEVTIKVVEGISGTRIWIPEDPNLISFTFNGNINKKIKVGDVGRISQKVHRPIQDRMMFAAVNSTLKLVDTYKRCAPTVTKVLGVYACAGQTIFEDNFDTFNSDLWQIEQYIPFYSTEFPFVSYQALSDAPTVSVNKGNLRLALTLQQNQTGFSEDSIYSGTLDLSSKCTSTPEACKLEAWGASILPPIVGGKITSKTFAFTYGSVFVRAKLPKGDWVYPEILLEPFAKKYGDSRFKSGVIKIASARGNEILELGKTDYSNKVLFGGPIMDFQCHDSLLKSQRHKSRSWSDDFHVYAVQWEPDMLSLSVDGEEWARVVPASKLINVLPAQKCKEVRKEPLDSKNKMAPFDDHFYLTLGVAAGSVTEFPDNVLTKGGHPKPWRNPSRKAMLTFWQDIGTWLKTWNQPHMLVDYVKVVAL